MFSSYDLFNKTLKCNLTVEECPQCQGIWLDNSKLNESHEKARYAFIEYEDSKDSSMKDSNYYYYKKEFIENSSVKDLFDSELE